MKTRATWLVLLFLTLSLQGWDQDFPTLGEIYDFDPGDEFHLAHFYCCNELSFQVEKILVKERLLHGPELHYIVERSVFDLLTTAPPLIVDTTLLALMDTLIVEFPDSVIFRPGDTGMIIPGMYNGRMTFIHTYWILNTLKEEWYVPGCGRVFNGWRVLPGAGCDVVDSLIYFKKDSESWGSTLLDATASGTPGPIHMFPNPAGDFIVLKIPLSYLPAEVQVRDAGGKALVSTASLVTRETHRISLAPWNYPSGLYFVYIRSREGELVKKLIIRRP